MDEIVRIALRVEGLMRWLVAVTLPEGEFTDGEHHVRDVADNMPR